MIPKILHLCWLSNDPFPADIQRYIDSWKRVLPDYEIWKWDFNRFPKEQSAWVAEAFDNRKYAFAADYIRNYALYNHGGIYMDADVEVLKSFDNLLKLPYFLGFENGSGYIDAGIMAATPKHPIFKEMLQYYQGRHFINPDGTMNVTPLPRLMTQVLSPKFKITPIADPDHFNPDPEVISVLPHDFFSPIHFEHKRLEKTSRTMAIHHFAASWTSGWQKHRRVIKKILGPTITGFFISLKRTLLGKSHS